MTSFQGAGRGTFIVTSNQKVLFHQRINGSYSMQSNKCQGDVGTENKEEEQAVIKTQGRKYSGGQIAAIKKARLLCAFQN